jgi:lipoprotein NlpD
MPRKFTMRGVMLSAVIGVAVVVTGCSGPRGPAPVESRTIYKSSTPTKQGASETRVAAGEPAPAGFYRVRRGDTLIGISLDHGVSWRDLADWNGISNPNLIEVDQLLRVQPPGGAARVASAPAVVPATPAPAPASKPAPATEVKPITPQTQPAPPAQPPQPASQTASVASPAGSPTLSWPSSGRVITQFAEPGYKGIAFSGQEGDPVMAAGDGRVVYSGSGLRGYGNLVIVKHEGDFLTAYAHNRKILVNEGQTVKRGQQIAELGSTDSDIPKLHFEVRLSGKPVDPMRYLAQR